MEKKQMLTGIFLIPTLHMSISRDTNAAIKAIVYQLGALNCEPDNHAAVIKYTGLLSKETKEVLDIEAKNYGHNIAYIEAEYETPFADCDTFHIPTNEEMIIHLESVCPPIASGNGKLKLENENYFKEGKVNHP